MFKPSPGDVKLALLGGFLGAKGADGVFSGRIQGTLSKPKIIRADEGG